MKCGPTVGSEVGHVWRLEERTVIGGLTIGPRLHLGAPCPECGQWVGRSRGNLRERKSWVNAVNAMMLRHLRLHHPPTMP